MYTTDVIYSGRNITANWISVIAICTSNCRAKYNTRGLPRPLRAVIQLKTFWLKSVRVVKTTLAYDLERCLSFESSIIHLLEVTTHSEQVLLSFVQAFSRMKAAKKLMVIRIHIFLKFFDYEFVWSVCIFNAVSKLKQSSSEYYNWLF